MLLSLCVVLVLVSPLAATASSVHLVVTTGTAPFTTSITSVSNAILLVTATPTPLRASIVASSFALHIGVGAAEFEGGLTGSAPPYLLGSVLHRPDIPPSGSTSFEFKFTGPLPSASLRRRDQALVDSGSKPYPPCLLSGSFVDSIPNVVPRPVYAPDPLASSLHVSAAPCPDSSLTCLAGLSDLSDELQALPPLTRVALCSAVDSYSDEIGIRVTPLLVRLASPPPHVNSFMSCLLEKLHGLFHLLRLGLFAGTSFVKLSIKATTLQKCGLSFDSAIEFWRSFSMKSLLLNTIFSVQECGIVSYVTVTLPTHYAVSSIDGSSQNLIHDPFIVAVTTVQECGYVSSSHYFINVASSSQYAVSSINGSLQSQLYVFSTSSLVAGTYVQECGVASYNRFYATIAVPAHYVVSSVDDSSHSCSDNPLTGTTIFFGGSPTPRSQNPLIGPFIVVLRTRALGLQVKLLYGSLLSLATPIPFYVLVVFVYQFTVEFLSGCINPCPLGL